MVKPTCPRFEAPRGRGRRLKGLLVEARRMVVALSLGFSFLTACSKAPSDRQAQAPVAAVVDASLAEQGRRLFTQKACDLCHHLDGSPATGPGLAGIGKTADRKTLMDWCMDPEAIYRRAFVNLPFTNGDDSWELPIPATFVVDRDGTIVYSSANEDYTERPEPVEILHHLANLSS